MELFSLKEEQSYDICRRVGATVDNHTPQIKFQKERYIFSNVDVYFKSLYKIKEAYLTQPSGVLKSIDWEELGGIHTADIQLYRNVCM